MLRRERGAGSGFGVDHARQDVAFQHEPLVEHARHVQQDQNQEHGGQRLVGLGRRLDAADAGALNAAVDQRMKGAVQ